MSADPAALGLPVTITAYAKVNLSLHVTGQRPDGNHLLDSLVVRVDVGDVLRITAADTLQLIVDGPQAAGVPDDSRNLVVRAAQLIDAGTGRGATLHLTKNLPSAAGIGGGSADAAAVLLALSEHWGVPLPVNASALGADVPVCLADTPQRMQGVGEILTPMSTLPPCWIVLVNPGIEVPTGTVFDALESKLNPAMPDTLPAFEDLPAFADWLADQRNDLEPPARAFVPEIATCLAALDDALLARMSGSGATCFGLYSTAEAASGAARRITAAEPAWWVANAKVLS